MADEQRAGLDRLTRTRSVSTSRGPAEVLIEMPEAPVSVLVLGHGAGGDVTAPDLAAVTDAALRSGVLVARLTQPYRVAGRRAPAPARHLDDAWTETVTALRAGGTRTGSALPAGLPLVVGGRSSGARVACRTATALGAAGVLALAFPLHPPGRPDRSRAGELATGLPTLVVNGDRDPFGVPAAAPGVQVLVRPGETHALRVDPAAVGAAAVDWLAAHTWARM